MSAGGTNPNASSAVLPPMADPKILLVRAVRAISRIFIAQAARAPGRLEALFKARIAAMPMMTAGADGTPGIFPVALGVILDGRRVLSCSVVAVDIFPAVAAAAIDIAHDRIARVCGRGGGRREEDEQNERGQP
jgi:hypothetical protein